MRCVGLIGGTSWHSTVEYYRHLNQAVNDLHGDNTNPPLLLVNLNQKEVHRLQALGRWDRLASIFIDAARRLEAAGAEALVLCANTPHRMYPQIAAAVQVPILHIADATGAELGRQGVARVGLIGTLYVMRDGYIADWIRDRHRVDVVVPPEDAWPRIQSIIQKELAMGVVEPDSTRFMLEQARALRAAGAEGVVLGCTELHMAMDEEGCGMPVFDTARLHAEMAVRFITS